jgi:UDP-arabinose 4-epimerase
MNLRYFNAAGADPEGKIGEDHSPETHLIPLVIAAAQAINPHVEIFGTDFDTPDGTAIRDFVHVCDLAAAHVLAVEHLLSGRQSASVNLGTGFGHSVRDVIAAVEEVSGKAIPVVERPRRAGDPAALIANSELGQALLGWIPKRSDLLTTVRTAWNWHEKKISVPGAPTTSEEKLRAELV